MRSRGGLRSFASTCSFFQSHGSLSILILLGLSKINYLWLILNRKINTDFIEQIFNMTNISLIKNRKY